MPKPISPPPEADAPAPLFNWIPRIIRRQPLFAAAAIGVVAIGIALATTAASLVDALVFRPIPTVDHHALYRIDSGVWGGLSTPIHARGIMERLPQFEVFSYTHTWSNEFSYGNTHALITTGELMGDAVRVLGWSPAMGRFITEADCQEGAAPVAVLSHRFWKETLGGSPQILGEGIRINGKLFQVVGVLPPRFDRVNRTRVPAVWIPYIHTGGDWKYESWSYFDQFIIARIPEGTSMAELQTILEVATEDVMRLHPNQNSKAHYRAVPERVAALSELGDLRGRSYLISGLIGALLLIACFNVGNMLLANAYRREREFAIRRAIGASSRHLFRQILGESLVVAVAGGVLGCLLAIWLIPLAGQLNFRGDIDLVFDRRIMAVALGITLLMGLLSGLVPAYHMALRPFSDTLKRGSRGSAVSYSARILVIGQVAFCAGLLTCCLLFFLSLRASLQFKPDYDIDRIVFFDVYMQGLDYERRTALWKEVPERIENLPGVEAVGLAIFRPLSMPRRARVRSAEVDLSPNPDDNEVLLSFVTPGFHHVLGIPMVDGRDFEEVEISYPFERVIINETMARRFWPQSNPIGQRVYMSAYVLEVVGIVRDFSNFAWEAPRPMMWLPHYETSMVVWVRTKDEPMSVIQPLHRIANDGNGEYFTGDIRLYEDAQRWAFRELDSTLRINFVLGVAALLLSIAGTWYLTRQFVRIGRKDMCIRLALGAQPRQLLVHVVRRSLTLTLTGIAAGGLILIWVLRHLRDMLPGTEGLVVLAFLAVSGTLLLIAATASYLPARSTLKLEPREVLNEV